MLFCLFLALFFQLVLTGVSDCQAWRVSVNIIRCSLAILIIYYLQSTNTFAKDQDIVSAIVTNVASRCGCDFGSDRLTERVFQCFSPKEVAYQAQLHGTLQANASQLAALLQDWASSVMSIPVQFLPLSVHNFCAATSSSSLFQQCSQEDAVTTSTATPPKATTDANTSSNQAPIIIAVAVAICATIIVILIVVVILIIHRNSNKRLSLDPQNSK